MAHRTKAGLLVLLLGVLLLLVGRLWLVRAMSAEALEARINGVLAKETGGLYRIEIGTTQVGATGGWFTAIEVEFLPDTAVFARQAQEGNPARTRYAMTVPRIEFTGIGRLSLLGGGLSVRNIAVHDPDIRIQLDRRISGPREGLRSLLPHERLLQAGRMVSVGQLQVRDGRVRYAERAPDGARFGTFNFERLQATAAGITNERDGAAEVGIVPIELSVLLGGTARMTASLRYDVRSPGLNLTLAGGLGPTNARIFNPMLVDLEGVRITGGEIDTIGWKLKVEKDAATGEFLALYRDFSVERLDKVTRDKSLEDRLVSFIGNHFTLHTSNPPSPGNRVQAVPVAHRRDPDVPLIKFLWVTLRLGLAKTIGL